MAQRTTLNGRTPGLARGQPYNGLTLSLRWEEQGLNFAATDTGRGMSPAGQRQISTPFFTTKPNGQGTGFGLAFCARVVQAHRGKIRVRSKPGIGARSP